jgi:predicted  nucleic acid-binding Zn-ribbon protein
MAGATPIDAAMKRLQAALGHLEDAVDRRIEEDQRHKDLEAELQRIGGDRSRLAQLLDAEKARSARLEEANRDVSRRIVGAMESIRSVIERHGG